MEFCPSEPNHEAFSSSSGTCSCCAVVSRASPRPDGRPRSSGLKKTSEEFHRNHEALFTFPLIIFERTHFFCSCRQKPSCLHLLECSLSAITDNHSPPNNRQGGGALNVCLTLGNGVPKGADRTHSDEARKATQRSQIRQM